MEFKNILKNFRERANVSKADLARKIGISSGNYFVNIESGQKRPPTLERCQQIAEALRLSKDDTKLLIDAAAEERTKPETREWLKQKESEEIKSPKKQNTSSTKIFNAPEVGVVHAGSVEYIKGDKLTMYPLPSILFRGHKEEDIFLMQVEGDCLKDSHIKDGALVIATRMTHDIKDGDIVIVNAYEKVFCRKYYKMKDGKMMFCSDNADKKEPPLIYDSDDEIEVVGKVLWVLQKP